MKKILVAVALAACAVPASAAPKEPAVPSDRAQVAEKYTWNTADLYPSIAAALKTRDALAERIPSLARFQGHLADSPAALFDALDAVSNADRDLSRLYTYSSMRRDEDTRVNETLALLQSVQLLAVKMGATTSYLRPEILAMDPAKVQEFQSKEPRLAPFKMLLDDLMRRRAHTLSASEEKLVAQAGDMAGAGAELHSIFTNAELPYPTVTLSTGEKAYLDASGYGKYRAATNRADRELVFKAFWDEYGKFRRTMASSLYAAVKSHIFFKDARKFDSSLDAALFDNNIPTSVYRQLVADVHANLPTLHRYLELRRRIMGLDKLRYQDIYAPLVPRVEKTYTAEEATDLTLGAVAPLGPDYVAALRKGFADRWVDFMPTMGKRSGAYSTGAYGVHPFQLQNFNGQYDDVSTLAHESGHSMHTFLSDKRQPYPTHDYSIFVAEVASTLNENLLLHFMLDRTQDDATRLALLGNYLDGLRGTLFRQTLFAEFELKIHEMAEKGEPLTADALDKLYLDLTREYYGHDKGICQVDDMLAVEWAYIPHFYYNFYVYQYATSLVASTSIAKAIREEAAQGKTTTRDAYLTMLSSGSSKYPIDLLKGVGVDMTTSKPFQAAIAEMNAVMDDMDKILARAKK